ncbi:MAG: type II/IV secretion system protein [Candidatus Lindowbacteria bacterium]|nr:type II/IV secretion system protein [Candidatus Lindowbacteria bacterium]
MPKVLIQKGFSIAEKHFSKLRKDHDVEYIEKTSSQPDSAAVELIPQQVIRDFNVFPLSSQNGSLRLAMSDPKQMDNLDKYRVISSLEVVPVFMPADEIGGLIEQTFTRETKKAAEEEAGVLSKEVEKLRSISARKSPVEIVTAIIAAAVNSRATDIHFDPQSDALRVRYRIDGVLYDIISLPRTIEPGIISRLKILCNMDITNTRTPQDGHFTTEVAGRNCDLRVATVATYFGEKLVLRFLGRGTIMKGLGELGMDPADQRAIERFIQRKGGMLLVTGPMGSGKTTTLYAVLNRLNVLAENIVTIEDPVEFQLSGVNQVQVNPLSDLGYTRVLRGALRLDIDTLMVGEIRDDESAHIAVRAAVTGHRVLSTMHTNNALETITAMRHMNIKSFMIASGLNVVIAQRLVRTNCNLCKEEYEPPKDLLAELKLPESAGPFFRGKGCPHCNDTGFFGRSGLFEVLKVDEEIRARITAGVSVDEIAKMAADTKMKFILERGAQKVAAGITTAEEVLRAIGA